MRDDSQGTHFLTALQNCLGQGWFLSRVRYDTVPIFLLTFMKSQSNGHVEEQRIVFAHLQERASTCTQWHTKCICVFAHMCTLLSTSKCAQCEHTHKNKLPCMCVHIHVYSCAPMHTCRHACPLTHLHITTYLHRHKNA